MASTGTKCVLVVDDDDSIRSLVSDILKLKGYRVEMAGDGQQALAKMQTALPDAVVLDLRMPVMDGWTFLEQFRSDPRWRGLPVVVMSAYVNMFEDATQALQAQAVLAKPFDVHQLVNTVERFLEMPSLEV